MDEAIKYLLSEIKEHRLESSVRFKSMDDKLEAIKTQTTITNGRVGRTEKDVIEIFDEVEILKSTGNVTKGSNKIIHSIWKAAGAIALIVIAAFLSYYSAKK